jgi:hypothetical protein
MTLRITNAPGYTLHGLNNRTTTLKIALEAKILPKIEVEQEQRNTARVMEYLIFVRKKAS